MIVDLLFLNMAMWSIFIGSRINSKFIFYKVLSFVIAIVVTVSYHENVNLFDQEVTVSNMMDKEYTIPVAEEHTRDYLLTKAFVEELPVTTEIQNKVIQHYYYENTQYIAHELVEVSGNVITKIMEMLLVFTTVLVFLNGLGIIINKKKDHPKRGFVVMGINCIINMLGNLVIISSILFLIKLVLSFYITGFPVISFTDSLFKPIIYKVIDIIIKFL